MVSGGFRASDCAVPAANIPSIRHEAPEGKTPILFIFEPQHLNVNFRATQGCRLPEIQCPREAVAPGASLGAPGRPGSMKRTRHLSEGWKGGCVGKVETALRRAVLRVTTPAGPGAMELLRPVPFSHVFNLCIWFSPPRLQGALLGSPFCCLP